MSKPFLQTSPKSSACVEATQALASPVKSLKRSISALSINSIGSMNHITALGPGIGRSGAGARKNRKIPPPFEENIAGDLTSMKYKPDTDQCHLPLIDFSFDLDDQCSTTSSRISSPILHSSTTGVYQDNHWSSQNSSFRVDDSSRFKKPTSTRQSSISSSHPSPVVNRYPPCLRSNTNASTINDRDTKNNAGKHKPGAQRLVRNIRDSLLCSGNRLLFLKNPLTNSHDVLSLWSKDTSMTLMLLTTDKTINKLKKLARVVTGKFKKPSQDQQNLDLEPIYQPDLALLYQMNEDLRRTKSSGIVVVDDESSRNLITNEVFGIPIDVIKANPDTIGAIIFYLMNESGKDKSELQRRVLQIVLRKKNSRSSVVSGNTPNQAVQRQPSNLNKSFRAPSLHHENARKLGRGDKENFQPSTQSPNQDKALPERFAALGILSNQNPLG